MGRLESHVKAIGLRLPCLISECPHKPDARRSTDRQDLAAQLAALADIGAAEDRIYTTDRDLTGTNRESPEFARALTAARDGDALVVPKLDRLTRSVSDTRAIANELTARDVKPALGASVHGEDDPMGKMFFNALAIFAGFGADLIRMRAREDMGVARAKVG